MASVSAWSSDRQKNLRNIPENSLTFSRSAMLESDWSQLHQWEASGKFGTKKHFKVHPPHTLKHRHVIMINVLHLLLLIHLARDWRVSSPSVRAPFITFSLCQPKWNEISFPWVIACNYPPVTIHGIHQKPMRPQIYLPRWRVKMCCSKIYYQFYFGFI